MKISKMDIAKQINSLSPRSINKEKEKIYFLNDFENSNNFSNSFSYEYNDCINNQTKSNDDIINDDESNRDQASSNSGNFSNISNNKSLNDCDCECENNLSERQTIKYKYNDYDNIDHSPIFLLENKNCILSGKINKNNTLIKFNKKVCNNSHINPNSMINCNNHVEYQTKKHDNKKHKLNFTNETPKVYIYANKNQIKERLINSNTNANINMNGYNSNLKGKKSYGSFMNSITLKNIQKNISINSSHTSRRKNLEMKNNKSNVNITHNHIGLINTNNVKIKNSNYYSNTNIFHPKEMINCKIPHPKSNINSNSNSNSIKNIFSLKKHFTNAPNSKTIIKLDLNHNQKEKNFNDVICCSERKKSLKKHEELLESNINCNSNNLDNISIANSIKVIYRKSLTKHKSSYSNVISDDIHELIKTVKNDSKSKPKEKIFMNCTSNIINNNKILNVPNSCKNSKKSFINHHNKNSYSDNNLMGLEFQKKREKEIIKNNKNKSNHIINNNSSSNYYTPISTLKNESNKKQKNSSTHCNLNLNTENTANNLNTTHINTNANNNININITNNSINSISSNKILHKSTKSEVTEPTIFLKNNISNSTKVNKHKKSFKQISTNISKKDIINLKLDESDSKNKQEKVLTRTKSRHKLDIMSFQNLKNNTNSNTTHNSKIYYTNTTQPQTTRVNHTDNSELVVQNSKNYSHSKDSGIVFTNLSKKKIKNNRINIYKSNNIILYDKNVPSNKNIISESYHSHCNNKIILKINMKSSNKID